jgi:thioredoxin
MSEFILDTSDATFDNDVLQSRLPVLLDFWAPWCGPCKALAPALERIATQHTGRLKVVKYNVDQNQGAYARFKIRGIPTLIAFRDGEEVARCTGGSPGLVNTVLNSLLHDLAGLTSNQAGAYGGEAERKSRCLERVRQAIADGRLSAAGQDADASEVHLPSLIAGGKNLGSGGDTLGLPPSLEVLHDYFYERLPSDGSDSQFALNWLDAIPVGADLLKVPRDYLLWLLADPLHGILRHLPPQGLAAEWLLQLVALHQRESMADPVSTEEWKLLHEHGEALVESMDGDLKEACTAAMRALRSGDSFAPTVFPALIDVAGRLNMMQIYSNWWSSEEAAVFHGTHRAMSPFVRSLGPKPEETKALDEYQRKLDQFIKTNWAKAYEAFPQMEQGRVLLRSAMDNAIASTRAAHARYLLERLAWQ